MLYRLETFKQKHRLSSSKKKSKIMIINHTKEGKEHTWKIGQIPIETTETYSYLGEIIQYKNSISSHLEDKEVHKKFKWNR